MHTLRPYGPGKYDLIIDERVDALSFDEECGSVSENGMHYGLINGPFFDDIEKDGLTHDELDFLKKQVGAIVATNSDGFTTITYFEDHNDLMTAWRRIEEELEQEHDKEGESVW